MAALNRMALLGSASMAAALLGAGTAAAQSAIGSLGAQTPLSRAQHVSGPAQTNEVENIVVTARKRAEKLLSVPVAITAFTAKSLQQRAIYSIADLASQTPGLTVDATVGGSGRSDRSFPEYVIRGMVPSLTTNPTTTVFIDGAPLISGQIDSLDDLERVEVLKGPQSAYFGRETFAGAISLITKDPSPTPKATIDALVASPNYYDERGSLEGSVIPGILTMRGSYRFYSRQGSYDNNAVADKAPGHLGDQQTQDAMIEAVATPIENLKIKVDGMYWNDNDGPSAQYLVLPSQSNCLGFWFCGNAPQPAPGQPAANTLITPQAAALLHYLGTPAGEQPFKPLKDSYGLERNAYHGSVNIDYYLPSIGVTATSLTAIDNQRYSELQDLANDDGSGEFNFANSLGLPFADPYNDFPFFVENSYRSLSEEFRLTSDSNQRFRWLAGFNYEWSRVDSGLGGGNGFDFFVGHAPEVSKVYSGFYGLAYDITKNLTLDFDGRYQVEDISTSPVTGTVGATYSDFLPRVSLQWRFAPQVMAYATYSVGVNPGSFNGFITTDPVAIQQELAADGARVQVKPEHLTNYEAGVKGQFLDNTLTLAADGYYDLWHDQIDIETIQYFVGNTLEMTTADLNNGKTDLYGAEADATWQPIRQLVFNVSGAINDTAIRSGPCSTCFERIGTTDVNGNQLPDVSKYQSTIGAQYTDDLFAISGHRFPWLADWQGFARVDYSYKSKQFEDKDNLVHTPAQNLVNLRLGVTRGNLRVEGFVDNVTNYSGPTSLAAIVDLGSPTETYTHANDALVAGLPFKRAFGLRVRYTFD